MTMRFIITVAQEAHDGSDAAMTRLATIERNTLAPETLGLTLAEAKAILTDLQAAIVADQIAAHENEERSCRGCKAARPVKGHRSLTYRTVFGTIQTKAALRERRGEPGGGGKRSRADCCVAESENIVPLPHWLFAPPFRTIDGGASAAQLRLGDGADHHEVSEPGTAMGAAEPPWSGQS
jgi:hypothetical protein